MPKGIIKLDISKKEVESLLVKASGIHDDFKNCKLVKSNLTDDVTLEFIRVPVQKKPMKVAKQFNILHYEWVDDLTDDQKTTSLNTKLEDMNMPVRIFNRIQRYLCTLAGNCSIKLGDFLLFTEEDLKRIQGFGPQTIYHINKFLKEKYGVCIRKW